jgi:hypothetical protein
MVTMHTTLRRDHAIGDPEHAEHAEVIRGVVRGESATYCSNSTNRHKLLAGTPHAITSGLSIERGLTVADCRQGQIC